MVLVIKEDDPGVSKIIKQICTFFIKTVFKSLGHFAFIDLTAEERDRQCREKRERRG